MLLLVVLVALGAVVWFFHRERAVNLVGQHLSEEQREQIGRLTEEASNHLRKWADQMAQAVEDRAVRRLAPRASFGLAMDEFNEQDLSAPALVREGALEQRLTELEALEAVFALADEIHQTDRELLIAYRTLLDFLHRGRQGWSVDSETGEVRFTQRRDELRYQALQKRVEELRQQQQEQLAQLQDLLDPPADQEEATEQDAPADDEGAPTR